MVGQVPQVGLQHLASLYGAPILERTPVFDEKVDVQVSYRRAEQPDCALRCPLVSIKLLKSNRSDESIFRLDGHRLSVGNLHLGVVPLEHVAQLG